MNPKELDMLLRQEMENVRGGDAGTCTCTSGAYQSSSSGGTCECDTGAAQSLEPETGKSCFCDSGALQK